jgi:hypothetical protein
VWTAPAAVACKAGSMTEPYIMNGLYLAFADMLYGDQADPDAAEQAFNSTDWTFFERITATMNALLRPHLKPETFIQIPEDPEQMTRADLDALVRPVAEGFLRSQPTKDEAAQIGEQWTPRELRHSFVSLMSSSGVPVEEIARLAGHSSSRTTEVVYRRELRPVLTTGAEAMDRLFKVHAPQ